MAFKVVLEVLLDVPEVVRVVLVVALMSRCPFQRLQSAGQKILHRLVLASMKSYRPHNLTQASYGPKLHFAKF